MTYGDNIKALAAFHRTHATKTMDDHDNLCPECNGDGVYTYIAGMWEQYPIDEPCPACDGTGKITAIPTEEEGYNPWEADEYERWLDSL